AQLCQQNGQVVPGRRPTAVKHLAVTEGAIPGECDVVREGLYDRDVREADEYDLYVHGRKIDVADVTDLVAESGGLPPVDGRGRGSQRARQGVPGRHTGGNSKRGLGVAHRIRAKLHVERGTIGARRSRLRVKGHGGFGPRKWR